MALRVRVCRRQDVPEGALRAFAVAGVDWPILVNNTGGTFLATTSRCPHEDVSLEDGEHCGTSITCPGHGYEFDMATGACAHDPRLRLRRYRVSFEGDDLYVDLI
jgi:nitrite reductase/ring-hydroxylating ferredoxin subunit